MSATDDIRHMRHVLRLAERSLGTLGPNPAVGCVIVSGNGRIVGRGHTQKGGRPHAEEMALDAAGARAHDATAYVTLEPCSDHGERMPCALALAQAGIARVVSAIENPAPRRRGLGHAILREAGVSVDVGVLAREASELNAGYVLWATAKRPLVTLKIVQSLDGRAATSSGENGYIGGERARAYGHLLRGRHDAVLIGIETALAEDPELTCRIPGLEGRSPVRVVLDSRLRLSEWSNLAKSAAEIPTLVFSGRPAGGALAGCGVKLVQVQRDARGRPDIEAVLKELAARGITRLLVEGGASVHAAFLDRGLADRLEVFSAPAIFGGAGRPSIDALAALNLEEIPRFARLGRQMLGPDLLESFAASA